MTSSANHQPTGVAELPTAVKGGASPDKLCWTYCKGQWLEGRPNTMGPHHHAVWLSSVVFDGARVINDLSPDLRPHCDRVVRSAKHLGLTPYLTGGEITDLAREGISRFPKGTPLYVCPMYYAEEGFIVPDGDSTQFTLSIYESPLPDAVTTGFSAGFTRFRRPARDQAPTEAKASCLYPNVARAVREANTKGFDTAVTCDPNGNVAEFAYANIFAVFGDEIRTPATNGTFLNGITRQRVILLLQDAGKKVVETTLAPEDLLYASEIFGTGNYYKVAPCIQLEDRVFERGPICDLAQKLYWNYASDEPV